MGRVLLEKRMRNARLLLVLLVLLTAACNPMAAAPTPTLVPFQLADQTIQKAAEAAVADYAQRLSYGYRNASYTLIDSAAGKATVHVTVSFQTRKDFPWEDYDMMVVLNQSAGAWQAEPIQSTSKIEWAMTPQRGPVKLTSAAGFTVDIPAGWAGYVAPANELKSPTTCGIGAQPALAVPVLAVMPIGYSLDNVPVILRGFQQCPRMASLSGVLQSVDQIRLTDKNIQFKRLDMTILGGVSALAAEMTDINGTLAYDYYVMHHDRQLEFVIQAHAGLDATQLVNVLKGIVFN
jgi:hypothetical protein